MNRPPHVEALSVPQGRAGVRTHTDSQSAVLGLENSARVIREPWRRRHLRESPPVGPAETDVSRTPHDLDVETLFVHRSMMAPAEQYQVVQPGLATVGPVFDVVRVAETVPTARETASPVPVVECPTNGGWHGPGSSAHIEH